MSEDQPKKPIANFETAIEALCQRYGYADWAVVARKADSSVKGWWVAGDGKNIVKDRERALLLHGEVAVLQDTIITDLKTPRII